MHGIKTNIGQAQAQRLASTQHFARHGQPFTRAPRATAEKIATAHVRKQANQGFRHGQLAALGHDAQTRHLTRCKSRRTAVPAQAHASAHHDAVHENDVRLREGVNQVVKGVFLGEEIIQLGVVFQCSLVKKANIATGTQRTKGTVFINAPNGHSLHRGIITPGQQASHQGTNHFQ